MFKKPLVISLFIIFLSQLSFCQKNWNQEYSELLETILSQMNEPTGPAQKNFEENLRWLDIKGEVRNRVEASLQELNRLYIADPENEEINQWVQKYYNLIQDAELSGSHTVFNACWHFLNTEDRWSKALYWDTVLWRVKYLGRPLLTKTKENRFDTYCIYRQVRCLLNFCVGDVEDNPYGLGLYWERKRVFGEMDDEGNINIPKRDFNVTCERRGDFILTEEGEPLVRADIGLAYVDLIREECLWWEFSDQYNDATDLMNQYYEDVLCQEPPHMYEMGHKWFLDLAKEYALEKSIEYNEGFYGLVEGIVEIVDGDDRRPASGAKVTIRDWGQEWTATANEEGMYKIEGANLHADCSPFDICATHKGDRTDDTYNGYLTEPDKTARLVKDLEIERSHDSEWSGTMTVERLERFECKLGKGKERPSKSTIKSELTSTRATISIKAENIDDSPPGFNIEMGRNLTVSGFMKCELRNYEETNSQGFNPPSRAHHVETLTGEDTYSLNDDNLNLTFMANIGDLQADGSLDELAKMLETGDIDEDKLKAFGAKFEESMGTGEEGTSKITVMMELFGDCMCKAVLTQKGWGEKNGKRTTTDESATVDIAIGGGFALEFSADYIRNKDGSATITGSYSKSIPITGGVPEGCPPRTETTTCTLSLSKRRGK